MDGGAFCALVLLDILPGLFCPSICIWNDVFHRLVAAPLSSTIMKAAGGLLLAASEQMLVQKTLDIRGAVPDRIFAPELMLWAMRMTSLFMLCRLATTMTPTQIPAAGFALGDCDGHGVYERKGVVLGRRRGSQAGGKKSCVWACRLAHEAACGVIWRCSPAGVAVSYDVARPYSTVTDFARLRGLSTSVPRASAV